MLNRPALAALALALSSLLASTANAEMATAETTDTSASVAAGPSGSDLEPQRRVNLSFNPAGLLVGILQTGSVTVAPTRHVALRASASYLAIPVVDVAFWQVNLGLPVYLDKAFHGVYLEPGFLAARGQIGGKRKVGGPTAMLGYHWTRPSGINLAVALGGGVNLAKDDDLVGASRRLFVDGSLQLGKAF
jgi:hypothetical protein